MYDLGGKPLFFVFLLETSIWLYQFSSAQASVFCWRLLGRRSCRGSPAASCPGTSWMATVCRRRLGQGAAEGHSVDGAGIPASTSWGWIGSWNFPLFIGFLGLIHLKNGCRISAINSYTWLVREEKPTQSANNELAANLWLKQLIYNFSHYITFPGHGDVSINLKGWSGCLQCVCTTSTCRKQRGTSL